MNERHVDCQWCRIGKTVNWNICDNFRPRVLRRSLARLFGLVKAVKIRNHGSSVADTLSGAFTGEFILHTPIGFDLLRPQRGWFRWFAIGFRGAWYSVTALLWKYEGIVEMALRNYDDRNTPCSRFTEEPGIDLCHIFWIIWFAILLKPVVMPSFYDRNIAKNLKLLFYSNSKFCLKCWAYGWILI